MCISYIIHAHTTHVAVQRGKQLQQNWFLKGWLLQEKWKQHVSLYSLSQGQRVGEREGGQTEKQTDRDCNRERQLRENKATSQKKPEKTTKMESWSIPAPSSSFFFHFFLSLFAGLDLLLRNIFWHHWSQKTLENTDPFTLMMPLLLAVPLRASVQSFSVPLMAYWARWIEAAASFWKHKNTHQPCALLLLLIAFI